MDLTDRLTALRALMEKAELAAYLVPSSDPHQSEYVADTWQRRAYISGFTGSAGIVVVTAKRAGLWTDARYFIQAEQQLAGSGITLFRMGNPGVPEPYEWFAEQLSRGDRLGVDPRVLSLSGYKELARALQPSGISLCSVDRDLVEQVWGAARPGLPTAPVRPQPIEVAGEPTSAKLTRLRDAMKSANADAHLLCSLDDIAWLFNLRGGDVEYNPVFIAFAVVEPHRARLFVDSNKLDEQVRRTLPDDIEFVGYESIDAELAALAQAGRRVWVDPATTSQRLASMLMGGGALRCATSPVPGWKAVKNTTELVGMRACHVRDGVAMVRLLRWLAEAVPAGGQTEISVADKLTEFRAQGDRFVGLSFGTIVGYAEHGAIVHYEATKATSSRLASQGILLLDAGAQYLDGTTDITRTLALGAPTVAQREAYTAVLQGHLALARAQFPEGTNGYQLDVIARAPLWARGMNYGHGTGHGVGAHLCAHEGPFSISLRKNMTPLVPGHVTSNEPGYYRAGEFGVRIENLVVVVELDETDSGRFFGFDDLTMCPYDRTLIEIARLHPVERQQIDAYHARVRDALSPLLAAEDRQWLEAATAPL